MYPRLSLVLSLVLLVASIAGCAHGGSSQTAADVQPGARERHFKSLKQLTFEGTNAEAYFSPDGQKLIYQGHTAEQGCDQVFTMNVDGSDKKLISTKGGRNTCSFFLDDKRVIYSSTHEAGAECPKEPDRGHRYVWEIYPSYDIYSADLDGGDLKPLTREVGYDAESTVCGGKIVFTSARSGDNLDIFVMNVDGTGVKKLTHEVGYNGGPFWSQDCKQIVYRAFHPKGKKATREFKKAVRDGYVPPGPLEVWIMSADGSHKRQLTNLHAASFAPSFQPPRASGNQFVIFSSNAGSVGEGGHGPGRVFQLMMAPSTVNKDDNPIIVTTEGTFNGFPMFSADGKYLVFASNRNSKNPHELQIFLAEWQD